MPMFLDPDGEPHTIYRKHSPPEIAMIERKTSEESIRTEDCDGPLLDDMNDSQLHRNVAQEFKANENVETSDRAELIERIKRGESPTWVPNRKVCSCYSRTIDRWICFTPFPIFGIVSISVTCARP